MRIESDGVGLHAEVDGPPDGAAVVFLHGLSGSARSYDWLPAEVTAGRHRYGADVAAVLRAVAERPVRA